MDDFFFKKKNWFEPNYFSIKFQTQVKLGPLEAQTVNPCLAYRLPASYTNNRLFS